MEEEEEEERVLRRYGVDCHNVVAGQWVMELEMRQGLLREM